MALSKIERKKLIAKISEASGVAQYALEAKMLDEQVIAAANSLKVFSFIKAANNYNRYCQAQKTAEANAKLKQFIDPKNSEIYKAGQWLVDSLSKVGQARKQILLEKDLVHKNDYNNLAEEAAQALDSIGSKADQQHKILVFFRQELGTYRYAQVMKKYQSQQGN